MSVLDEYIKINNKLVILVSGLSGSKRSSLAKEIQRDFSLKIVSLENYCLSSSDKEVDFSFGKMIDWEHIDVYDWDKFNADMVTHDRVVVYGDFFPSSKITFKPTFHIHIKISKEKLIKVRKEFIEKHKDTCVEMYNQIEHIDTIINKITYSHYIKHRNESKIDKWLDYDENTLDKLYEHTFNYLIESMTKVLNEYYSQVSSTDKHKKNDTKKHKKHKKNEENDYHNDYYNDDHIVMPSNYLGSLPDPRAQEYRYGGLY